MKAIMLGLLAMLAVLQYRLWVGQGSIAEAYGLKRQIAEQKQENERLFQRNAQLAAEVVELQQGYESVEQQARMELGMVRRGETLYILSEEKE
ncbi:septum formation initiator family protein [Endozoicomonadaceae bacterium StTr2]